MLVYSVNIQSHGWQGTSEITWDHTLYLGHPRTPGLRSPLWACLLGVVLLCVWMWEDPAYTPMVPLPDLYKVRKLASPTLCC